VRCLPQRCYDGRQRLGHEIAGTIERSARERACHPIPTRSPIFQPGTALFDYRLGRPRGIATEAARMLSDFALQGGSLRRLEATVFAPNVASAKVLTKCGFTLQGRSPGFYVDRSGAVCDGLLFGRTR
jgi:hypothetical protein